MSTSTAPRRSRASNHTNHITELPSNNHQAHTQKVPSTQSKLPKSHKATSKQQRRPRNKTSEMKYEVPDGDEDSFMSDEYSAMDLEGDSHEAEVDRINSNQRNKENVQPYSDRTARVLQQAKEAEQAREAQYQQYIRNTPPKYNLRPARPAREREPLRAGQTVFDLITPSSTGKRKRSESQPPARDTYHSDLTTDNPSELALRRISGMCVTVVTVAATWFAGVFNYFRGQQTREQEVLAAETDNSGRKRRAVPNGSFEARPESPMSRYMTTTTSPHAADFTLSTSSAPGAFPEAQIPSPESMSPAAEQPQDSDGMKYTSHTKKRMSYAAKQPQYSTETDQKSYTKESISEAAKQPEQSIMPKRTAKNNTPAVKKTQQFAATYPSNYLAQPNQKATGAHEQQNQYKTNKSNQRGHLPEMPGLREYTDIPSGGRDSIEPSISEMYARYGRRVHTCEEWDAFREEKKGSLRRRDLDELEAWGSVIDDEKQPEEEGFWDREKLFEKGERRAVSIAALKEKFGLDISERQMLLIEYMHALRHREGLCHEDENCMQKWHEWDGLRAHEVAKVWEAEVARDMEEFIRNNTSNQSSENSENGPVKRKSALARYTMRNGHTPTGWQPPKSVAAAMNAKAKAREAGATEEDDTSRPTSEHRKADYGWGLEPSPSKHPQGTSMERKWSWDKTMKTGKSGLKPNLKHGNEVKDEKVEALINKANEARKKNAEFKSPPKEARFKAFMESRREGRARAKADFEQERLALKADADARRAAEDRVRDQYLDELRAEWDKLRLEQKQVEEGRLAREAAEELAKQQAIEDERHRIAEEAARLKAEEEKEAARKAAEEEKKRLAAQQAAQDDYAEKQTLVRPLDPEWNERIKTAMAVKARDAVLATALDGTDLRRHDFGSLLPQEGTEDDSSGWLNDEIVNAVFNAIVQRKAEQTGYKKGANSTPAFEFYNSAWWVTYQKKGIESISRWSRRKGIQGKKLLEMQKFFLPVNTGAHWILVVISPKERKIEVLDSLNNKSERFFKAAREWLQMELGKDYIASEWKETSGASSRQTNVNDCGVFTAMNGLAAAKGYPYDAVKAREMDEARSILGAVLLNGGFKDDWEL